MIGRYVEIGDRIVVLENEYDANLTCISSEEGLIFVDTGRRDNLALKFRKDMEQKFNKETSHLLITHYHFDHYGAMAVFNDVEIIAAQSGYKDFSLALQTYLTKEKRREDVNEWKEEYRKNNIEPDAGRLLHWEYYPRNEIFLPTKQVKDELILGNDSEKIVFKVVGGHSKCTAHVYIPFEAVVHVSDNLATDSNGNDGVFLGHSMFFYRPGISSKTIDILEQISSSPIETTIPGHGPVINKEQTTRITKYLRDFNIIIRSSINEGLSLDELINDSRFTTFYDTKPDYWSTIIQRQYNLISEEIQIKK